MTTDWYDIKFLESAANLKLLVKKSWGKTPSTKIANDIAVCVQQGRYFFEAASTAPIQIKPLLIYYGVLGFSKSIVLASRIASIDSLVPSHGLTDISDHNAGVERLVLKVRHSGTFQDFNDAIAPLARVFNYENLMPTWSQKPFDYTHKFIDKQISLKEILSRIPELHQLYARTFQDSPNSCPLVLVVDRWGSVTLRIDDPNLFDGREGLLALIQKWIQAFPFLKHWRFSEGSLAWGYSILIFDNVRQTEQLTPDSLIPAGNGFSIRDRMQRGQAVDLVPYLEIIPPLSGGIIRSETSAIVPFDGANISEHSLQFLGTFLLSSLVRYRPQIWQHALSRSALDQKPSDDRSLALVERFFDVVLTSFPQLVTHCFDYARTN